MIEPNNSGCVSFSLQFRIKSYSRKAVAVHSLTKVLAIEVVGDLHLDAKYAVFSYILSTVRIKDTHRVGYSVCFVTIYIPSQNVIPESNFFADFKTFTDV